MKFSKAALSGLVAFASTGNAMAGVLDTMTSWSQVKSASDPTKCWMIEDDIASSAADQLTSLIEVDCATVANPDDTLFKYDPATRFIHTKDGRCLIAWNMIFLMADDCKAQADTWKEVNGSIYPDVLEASGTKCTGPEGISPTGRILTFTVCSDQTKIQPVVDPSAASATTSAPTKSPTFSPSPPPVAAPVGAPKGASPGSSPAGSPGGVGKGDPHFKTLGGHKFDFHGQCDLLFLRNEGFEHEMGMEIQLRTKQERFWSFIEKAALKLGYNVLEVEGGKEGVHYWINGQVGEPLKTGDEFFFSGFKVHFREVIPGKKHHFRIDLDNGDALDISNLREYVSVNIKAKSSKQFKESVGLVGSYPDGIMYARNGTTIIEDPNEFGNEWQVLETEPSLFQKVEGTVQAPQKCLMPPSMDMKEQRKQRRRLGESLVSQDDAEDACAGADKDDMEDCVYDVLATNNVELAGAY